MLPHPEIYQSVKGELEQCKKALLDLTKTEDFQISELQNGINIYLSETGKLVRPTITLLVAKIFDCDTTNKLIYLASGIELLHLSSLVHDDSIDDSTFRRGSATISSQWNNKIALIVGDYLYATSANFITKTGNIELVKQFSNSIRRLATGELREYFSRWNTDTSEEAVLEIISNKTASLFETSAVCGAIIAGANSVTVEGIRSFGHHLGMAFQIQDDIIDFQTSSQKIGKPIRHDLHEGIITLPLIYAMEDQRFKRFVELVFEKQESCTTEEIKRIYDIVQHSEGMTKTTELLKSHINKVKSQVKELPDSIYKTSLVKLIQVMFNVYTK